MNVEMTNEQYRQWSGAQQQRGSRLWALWWGLLTILVVAAMLMLAVDHFAPGIFSGLFRRAGFVVEQVAGDDRACPDDGTATDPVHPSAGRCSGRNHGGRCHRRPQRHVPTHFTTRRAAETSAPDWVEAGAVRTARQNRSHPRRVSLASLSRSRRRLTTALSLAAWRVSCNPGAAPTPWPTSSGPRPGQPGFADSFR
jgi:hypothetical protein